MTHCTMTTLIYLLNEFDWNDISVLLDQNEVSDIPGAPKCHFEVTNSEL